MKKLPKLKLFLILPIIFFIPLPMPVIKFIFFSKIPFFISIKFFLKPTMGLITALMIPNFLFTI